MRLQPLRCLVSAAPASRFRSVEKPLRFRFLEPRLDVIPQRRTARANRRPDAPYHALMTDSVFFPALPVVRQIDQHRHCAVHRIRKARLASLRLLELFPQFHKLRASISRQHPENALHRRQLRRFARFPASLGVNHRVARINFADVVHQEHLNHAIDIYRRLGIVLKRSRQQSDLPAVLRGIFVSLEPQRTRLPRHAFEFFYLQNEIDYVLYVHGFFYRRPTLPPNSPRPQIPDRANPLPIAPALSIPLAEFPQKPALRRRARARSNAHAPQSPTLAPRTPAQGSAKSPCAREKYIVAPTLATKNRALSLPPP